MTKTPKKIETRGRKARGGEAGYPATIRLTTSEREAYQAAADRDELSLAEWIRAACQDRLKRKKA